MIPLNRLRKAAQYAEPYEMLGVLYDQLSEAKTKIRKDRIKNLIKDVEGRIKND